MKTTVSQDHRQETEALRDVYCEELMKLAERNDRIVMLDADLVDASATRRFAEHFPERTFDCGIAEANMAGVAAVLGLNGYVPFIHTFGTFASRRIHDQVYVSGAYAGSGVKIVGTDPGVTAALNGGTHMPLEDTALMRAVPEMTVLEITDTAMLRDLLPKIAAAPGMVYIRLSRRLSFRIYEQGSQFEIGRAVKVRDGGDATVFAAGYCVADALAAAEQVAEEGIHIAVVDMFTIKPLDRAMVIAEAKRTGAVVTAENHNVIGGLGSAVAEALVEECPVPMERVGVDDRFGEVGTATYLADTFGISAPFIAEKVRRAVERKRG